MGYEFGPGDIVCIKPGLAAPTGYTQQEWNSVCGQVGIVMKSSPVNGQLKVFINRAIQVHVNRNDLILID